MLRIRNAAVVGKSTKALACIEALEGRRLLTSVISSAFEFETQQRNLFEFDADVSSLFTVSDLTVYNLTMNSNLLATNYLLDPAGTFTYALTFPGYTYGAVPDGNYETIIEKEGVEGLSDDHVLPFWYYSADFDRNRTVDIGDFAILAGRFNQPGTFSQGDTTYDGIADIGDFAVMARNSTCH